MAEEQPSEARYSINVPAELEGGAYANFLTVWHTEHEFTFDFSALQHPQMGEDGVVDVPTKVVSRVRIPPSLVFAILRAVNENLTRYEEQFGEISRPEQEEENDASDG